MEEGPSPVGEEGSAMFWIRSVQAMEGRVETDEAGVTIFFFKFKN